MEGISNALYFHSCKDNTMTHSGGKPHTNVGDRGQRYEVRAAGYPKDEESKIGWSDTVKGAVGLADAIAKAPGCISTTIWDRTEGRVVKHRTHK